MYPHRSTHDPTGFQLSPPAKNHLSMRSQREITNCTRVTSSTLLVIRLADKSRSIPRYRDRWSTYFPHPPTHSSTLSRYGLCKPKERGGGTKKEEEEGSVTLHDEMYIPDDDADRRDRKQCKKGVLRSLQICSVGARWNLRTCS